MIDGRLKEIENLISSCNKCEHASIRINPILDRNGNLNNKILVLGREGGNDERIQGLPFCGRSGKLLDSWLSQVNLSRKDIFVANSCQCASVKNRESSEEERLNCKPIRDKIIELVEPKIILTLGAIAISTIYQMTGTMTSMRGKWINHNNIWILPTWHPSYVLRNNGNKYIEAEISQDMKTLKNKIDELGLLK